MEDIRGLQEEIPQNSNDGFVTVTQKNPRIPPLMITGKIGIKWIKEIVKDAIKHERFLIKSYFNGTLKL